MLDDLTRLALYRSWLRVSELYDTDTLRDHWTPELLSRPSLRWGIRKHPPCRLGRHHWGSRAESNACDGVQDLFVRGPWGCHALQEGGGAYAARFPPSYPGTAPDLRA